MGSIRVCILIAAFVFLVAMAAPRAQDAALVPRESFPQLLTVDPDTARQLTTLRLVAASPMADNDIIVPWIRDNADRLQPMFLYELARRVFDQDHAAALEWYVLALTRARYDANRCADPSAGNGVGLLAQQARPVPGYAASHPDERAAAFRRVLARSDLFVDAISPMWICVHGLGAYGGAPPGGISAVPGLKPEAEWQGIRERLRQQVAEMGQMTSDAVSIPSGRLIHTLRHPDYAIEVAWSPDGTMLATTSFYRRRITLWDTATGKPIHEMMRAAPLGRSLAFTADGQYVITPATDVGRDDLRASFSLWSTRTGTLERTVPGPEESGNLAQVLAIDASGHLFAAANRERLMLYDTSTWTVIGMMPLNRNAPEALAFSPDGQQLAVGHISGGIQLFDVPALANPRIIKAYQDCGVRTLAYSPDGQILVSGPTIPLGRKDVDGKFHSESPPDPIRIWNVADGTLASSYTAALKPVEQVAFSPDGRYLASVSRDLTVRLWDVAAPGQYEIVTKFSRAASAVAFSPDGNRLAAAGDNIAVILDLQR